VKPDSLISLSETSLDASISLIPLMFALSIALKIGWRDEIKLFTLSEASGPPDPADEAISEIA
jgi:hypothetical protein